MPQGSESPEGIELKGQIGAVDWAQDMVGSCSDDETVRTGGGNTKEVCR